MATGGAAAQDFETAFRLAPDLTEARENWQIARAAAAERGVEVASTWQLGVFGTGTRNEATWDYAQTDARDLIQGRPQSFIYVAIKGNLLPAGVEKMQRQGVETVLIDPKSPETGHAQIESFVRESVASSAFNRSANDEVHFELTGLEGRSYMIRASTNLVDWQTIATQLSNARTLSFTDTNAVPFRQRFYRLKSD